MAEKKDPFQRLEDKFKGKIDRIQKVPRRKRKCFICGTRKNLTRHHIKPKSEGGTDDKENILILCKEHHSNLHNPYKRKKTLKLIKENENNSIQPNNQAIRSIKVSK